MNTPRIFLACPTYDGHRHDRSSQTLHTASTVHEKMFSSIHTSLLSFGFNHLWCQALNLRHQGVTHFAMLHSDIQPEDYWIDTLLAQMEKANSDIVSVVVPLKNFSGITSTAIDNDPWRPRRITLRESANLPETFCAEDVPWANGNGLLVNTGCWICRFTEDWVERVHFHIEDEIWINPETNQYEPRNFPEDWRFSRQANRNKIRIMATTAVELVHLGAFGFSNRGGYGADEDSPSPSIKQPRVT